MRFNCSSCQRELNIPEDKLPSSDKFKVRCPKCKQELILEKSKALTEGAKPGDAEPMMEQGFSSGLDSITIEPEIFPPGAKIVFTMVNDERWLEAISSFFQEMGYYESTAGSEDEATLKVRLNDYHVIILEDEEANRQIFDEVGTWNGLRRRECNVIALGRDAPSLDSKMSFELGVNFYLNKQDLVAANDLFRDLLRGYSDYYRWLYSARELEVGTVEEGG